MFFFKNHTENEAETLILDLFFKKALYEVKSSGLHLFPINFDKYQLGHTIKKDYIKLYTVDSGIYSILIF